MHSPEDVGIFYERLLTERLPASNLGWRGSDGNLMLFLVSGLVFFHVHRAKPVTAQAIKSRRPTSAVRYSGANLAPCEENTNSSETLGLTMHTYEEASKGLGTRLRPCSIIAV